MQAEMKMHIKRVLTINYSIVHNRQQLQSLCYICNFLKKKKKRYELTKCFYIFKILLDATDKKTYWYKN